MAALHSAPAGRLCEARHAVLLVSRCRRIPEGGGDTSILRLCRCAPAPFRVKVIRRPRYGCPRRRRSSPAPERPIDGAMASEAILVPRGGSHTSRPSLLAMAGAGLRAPRGSTGHVSQVGRRISMLIVALAMALRLSPGEAGFGLD